MYSKDHLETLFIEKLLYGGSGLSHIGSMACFIDDVIPGETVSATITTVKKQYVTASLTEICESSPHRINPICAYFKYCGGCQWQHIDYHYQLHWKRLIVEDCLNRIGRMSDAAVLEIIPSDSQFQYRSRTNLKVSSSGIGYHQRGTRNIIPVSCCPLLPPSLNQALSYATNLHSKNTSLFKGITEIQLLLINRTQQVIISLLNESELKATLLYTPGGTTDVSINDIFLTASEHSYCDIISGITFYRR